eukprot:7379325-Prymnesium_polylepis.2
MPLSGLDDCEHCVLQRALATRLASSRVAPAQRPRRARASRPSACACKPAHCGRLCPTKGRSAHP